MREREKKMKELKTKEKVESTENINRDEDGMVYFGMFTETEGKIIYKEFETKEQLKG